MGDREKEMPNPRMASRRRERTNPRPASTAASATPAVVVAIRVAAGRAGVGHAHARGSEKPSMAVRAQTRAANSRSHRLDAAADPGGRHHTKRSRVVQIWRSREEQGRRGWEQVGRTGTTSSVAGGASTGDTRSYGEP